MRSGGFWLFPLVTACLAAVATRLYQMTRAGIVAFAGRPNAGKSTLLNRLVGETLAITSPKPQSTRERVVGLVSDEATQLVILDTPGLLDPQDALHTSMRAATVRAMRDADVIVHVADASRGMPPTVWDEAAWEGERPRAPVVVALTKLDLLTSSDQETLRAGLPDAVFVSARDGTGVATLLARLRALIPESPFLYPADDISTQNLRFFVAELVREAALEQLDDEVPHALACVVEEFREARTPVYIRVVLYVERESQKRIVIGTGGARVREIGRRARAKVERLVGAQVYLDVWVKVLPNWRRDPAALRRLGYSATGEPRT
jgi:GTP-binding protein Era